MTHWNNRKREELELRLIRLHDELSGLDEYFAKPIEHRVSFDDHKDALRYSVNIPSHREIKGKEDRRDYVRDEIEACHKELSKLKK